MPEQLTREQPDFCRSMAWLFWWQKPEELPARPERTLAGVMARGGVGEWEEMERLFEPAMIIRALETAVCGEFEGWAWRFWRLRYGLPEAPLPARLPGQAPGNGEPWYKALQRKSAPVNLDDPAERLAWTKDLRNRSQA